MRHSTVVVTMLSLGLAACGSLQQTVSAIPIVPKTEAEVRADNLACKQQVFSTCMAARGYKVSPNINGLAPSGFTALSASLPPGWASKQLSTADHTRGIIVQGQDAANDLHAVVVYAPKTLEPSVEAMLEKRAASLAATLQSPSRTQAEEIRVGAQKAYRASVSGTLPSNNVPIVYLVTAMDGRDESALVVAWTTAAAFSAHRSTLESVAHRVTGLK